MKITLKSDFDFVIFLFGRKVISRIQNSCRYVCTGCAKLLILATRKSVQNTSGKNDGICIKNAEIKWNGCYYECENFPKFTLEFGIFVNENLIMRRKCNENKAIKLFW